MSTGALYKNRASQMQYLPHPSEPPENNYAELERTGGPCFWALSLIQTLLGAKKTNKPRVLHYVTKYRHVSAIS